jgi:rubredoxin
VGPVAPLEQPAGREPHVINLSLLPLSAGDIAHLDSQLGAGRVLILSRGYGNCRITNTRLAHTWRVTYFNSTDIIILDTLEVCRVPEVACAAPRTWPTRTSGWPKSFDGWRPHEPWQASKAVTWATGPSCRPARLECKICWYGSTTRRRATRSGRSPPGTPFAALPAHWRLPAMRRRGRAVHGAGRGRHDALANARAALVRAVPPHRGHAHGRRAGAATRGCRWRRWASSPTRQTAARWVCWSRPGS